MRRRVVAFCGVVFMIFISFVMVGCRQPRPWYVPCSEGIWGMGDDSENPFTAIVRLIDAEKAVGERGFLTIPIEVDGRKVVHIGERPQVMRSGRSFFSGKETIQRIIIPDGIYVTNNFFRLFPAQYVELLAEDPNDFTIEIIVSMMFRGVIDNTIIIIPDGSLEKYRSFDYRFYSVMFIERSDLLPNKLN